MSDFCCICTDGGCNHAHAGPHTYCKEHDPSEYYGTATPRGCTSCASLRAEVVALKNVLRGDEEQLKRVVDKNAALRDRLVAEHQERELEVQTLQSRLAALEKAVEAAKWFAKIHDKDAKRAFDANRSYETTCPCRLCTAVAALAEVKG